MRIDWIEDLVAFLDTGGVADAAARRNITQPAFSRRLQALEDVLGVSLVDRRARPSGPSDALRDHEEKLRRMAAEQRILITSMRDAERLGTPQIALVCQHAISTSLGPGFVRLLSDGGTRTVRLRSANRDECEAILYAQTASISITYRVPAEPDAPGPAFLEQRVLGEDALVPVAGVEQAGALGRALEEGRLKLVGYPPDVFLGQVVARHIVPRFEAELEVLTIAETGFTSAALQMARQGIGVAWVPASLAAEDLADGKLLDLTGRLGRLDLEIVAQRLTLRPDTAVDQAWADLLNGPRIRAAP